MTPSAKRFKQILAVGPGMGDFCNEGHAWAETQGSLSKAWRTCQRGSWMAYWLQFYTHAVWDDIRAVARRFKIESPCDPYNRLGPETQKAFATALRARFNSDGSFRKGSKP